VSTTIMITGPAGAGKSQAAAAWAARGVTPRACIDTDVLRLHVRAGFAAPEHGWNDETQRQWDVAMELWPAMVRVYQRHDIDCAIDIYAPPCPNPARDAITTELGLTRVILLPSLQSCLESNRRRAREPLLEDEHLADNYSGFAECVSRYQPANVIDNGGMSIDETVDMIESLTDHSPT